jgi:hypothetical protein
MHEHIVQTFGSAESVSLLFPENGLSLIQEVADATEYENRFRALSAEEQLAIRRWTVTDADDEWFSDNTPSLPEQNIEGINYSLNRCLAQEAPLNPEESTMYKDLSSALNKLPSLSGEYLRISDYLNADHVPWGKTLFVGDIVTNFPCFMSASMENTYASLTLEDARNHPTNNTAFAFFKIHHAKTAVPLWRGVASQAIVESEVLFSPHSYFEVEGISIAEPVSERLPSFRVGVILKQISAPPPAMLKNLHTGVVVYPAYSPLL